MRMVIFWSEERFREVICRWVGYWAAREAIGKFLISENFGIFLRLQNDLYKDLMWTGLDEIERKTGCQKPCIFKTYSFPGDKQVVLQKSVKFASVASLEWDVHYVYLILYLAHTYLYHICTECAGDLTEIRPFRFLFGRSFKLHKCRDGTPHLSSFLVGTENDLSYIS